MPYCSQCGELAEHGRFCAACGAPVAPEAVAAAAAASRRHRMAICLITAALGAAFAAGAGLVISHAKRDVRGTDSSFSQAQLPSSAVIGAQANPRETISNAAPDSQQSYQPATASSGLSDPASQPPSNSAKAQLPPPPSDAPPLHLQAAETYSPGSDRYPGSQPIHVENANLPDIGVPVATEAYTTTDSITDVIDYYKQRYPDAEVTEVNGQHVIAISRPSMTKAIAIGTNGSETRIAIVQPK